jgi:hypothetical protein
MKMKKRSTALFAMTLALACIISGCSGCAMFKANRIRTERASVHDLVAVGHNISDAQRILIAQGYALRYEKPIHPTQAKDYVQQLVIIGETNPTAGDTVFYVTSGGKHPLRRESPYVVIEAGNDGIITRVE